MTLTQKIILVALLFVAYLVLSQFDTRRRRAELRARRRRVRRERHARLRGEAPPPPEPFIEKEQKRLGPPLWLVLLAAAVTMGVIIYTSYG